MRVFFSNLGCKLNRAELERSAREFVAAGHEIAPTLREADLHIVNSCTVTHVAARDSRKLARRGRRLKPGIKTVLTGCYVSGSPDEAAALAGVDLVVANDAKDQLLDRVHDAFPEERPLGVGESPLPVPYVPLAFGNSRALVKVEDGCNMRCAFCVVPRTRGRQRSRPLEAVVAEVRALAEGGFQEIVVTGVQISSYRHQGAGLYELVAALLERTMVPRLRLTSIAPWQFDPRLLGLPATGRLCRHFHLSLQSGCDATLRRMRRPYTAGEFVELVDAIRRRDPRTAITTDVIVGFPGEDDREFEESLELVRRIGFAGVHAFPFSPRPGTEAATLAGAVDPAAKKARMAAMLAVAESSRRAFWTGQLGTVTSAVWERRERGRWRGMTDHYIPVTTRAPLRPAHRTTRVRLERVTPTGIQATLHRGEPVAHSSRPATGDRRRSPGLLPA